MEVNEEYRAQILAKMTESRTELQRLLDPPPPVHGANGSAELGQPTNGGFPRSRTMRALMSSRGLGAVGALAGGLLLARPALALRLLRLVPVSAVGKMLMVKAVSALKSKSQE